ncbi:TetR/AcrR family transcriptional regulator [Marinobacter subterrani]|uniref:TetR/AcrR family transcriptional regulator n=1 Tax=Marinobacter subterrani TaxID=1658765 RepID=UPI003872E1CD
MTAIAKQSGATPAMIHYYFGNKQGLYEAVLQHALGPILSRLQSATEYTPDGEDPLPRWSRAAGSREGRPEARHPALRSQS